MASGLSTKAPVAEEKNRDGQYIDNFLVHIQESLPMLWVLLCVAAILALAFFLRKAAKGTPFAHKSACAPYLEHLRGLENDAAQVHKKENLW